jgi:hypothetical protein
MYTEPNFFQVNQGYANESLPILNASKTAANVSEWIAFDQMNRDMQLEASAGGSQREVIYQPPTGMTVCW